MTAAGSDERAQPARAAPVAGIGLKSDGLQADVRLKPDLLGADVQVNLSRAGRCARQVVRVSGRMRGKSSANYRASGGFLGGELRLRVVKSWMGGRIFGATLTIYSREEIFALFPDF